ncbi:glycosyl transferase [Plectonema cf. radiosum LEGE 06105]|uniref:Glycosyl transferase n=1 Tax=Plectonema cf. radiosum LEGE 06105 TaxID=945769 RepID=A0A8J7JW14_9CYAN|nr:glycosyltransferase [Plectonema radiosum]MBE9215125.1 glycosyl transferase [Plectonema cf. radiosum LEGE 06105]
MITVTLGTIPFSFDRAIAWLDSLLDSGVISESVFVQHGTTDVSALAKYIHVKTIPIVETNLLMKTIEESRLIISHAGQGLTRGLAAQGASFILVPRLARYKEHIDDHQLWFAQGVEKLGIPYCTTLNNLEQAIKCPPPSFKGQIFDQPKLAEHLMQIYPVRS